MKIAPRFSTLASLFLVLALGALVLPSAGAEDEQGKKRWMLGMSHGSLRTVDTGGQAYHYITVKVTNKTGHARRWHPLVRAVTDAKDPESGADRIYVAGGFPEALAAIRRQEGNAKLVAMGTTAGKLADGATIEGVAIFGPMDPLYDTVRVQIFGLVNPIATYKVKKYGDGQTVIVDAVYWDRNQKVLVALREAAQAAGSDDLPEPDVEYQVVAERRYFQIVYERLGDEFQAEDDLITFISEGWKVDGDPKLLRVVNKKEG